MFRSSDVRAWSIRAAIVVAVLTGAGLVYERLAHPSRPVRPCMHAITAAQAARSQQGLPTTWSEALRQVDTSLAFTRGNAAAAGRADPGQAAGIAALEIARGQLTGDYADYDQARRALDDAFAHEPPGLGPHLLRATLNMTVHRLAPIAADLARVETYRLPDPGEAATAAAMRGDVLFYRGAYRSARPFYERANASEPGAGTAVRLATWWGKMGQPERARRYLDEAECGISGPQQQLQAFIATQRGALAMDGGHWDEAQAAFARAAAIFPGYWATELQLAAVLGLRGQVAAAERLLETIARRNRLPEAYDALAGLRRSRGDLAGSARLAAIADRLWRTRIALFPEAAYGHAVTHYLEFGDAAVALDLARRNYAARPYAPSATLLAAALIANRRPADALRVLAPALASGWTSADAQVVASEAYALTGQGTEAEAARQAALAINPHVFDRNAGLTWLEH